MRTRRSLVAVVAALLVATSLGGCETVGSLVDETRIGSALRELSSTVDAIDGLSLSYPDPELQGDYSYRVYLTMTATASASEDGVRTAMLAARNTLSDPLFDTNSAGLTLDAGDRGSFYGIYSGLSEEELDGELSYWFAVQHLVDAPVSVTLGTTEGDGGGAYQAMGINRAVDAGVIAAIAAVPAPASTGRSWSLPGLEAATSFPEGAALDLYTSLGDLLPRVDYWSGLSAHGVLVYWNGDGRVGVEVVLVGQEPATIAESADWPLVLRALDATVASGLPATFTVQPDESLGGVSVRWGACEQPYETPEIDAAFLDLLAPHGLPADAAPGGC